MYHSHVNIVSVSGPVKTQSHCCVVCVVVLASAVRICSMGEMVYAPAVAFSVGWGKEGGGELWMGCSE